MASRSTQTWQEMSVLALASPKEATEQSYDIVIFIIDIINTLANEK